MCEVGLSDLGMGWNGSTAVTGNATDGAARRHPGLVVDHRLGEVHLVRPYSTEGWLARCHGALGAIPARWTIS